MINPAMETDLVGELVEVYERRHFGDDYTKPPVVDVAARGRVRAVSDAGGNLRLWIEVLSRENGGAVYPQTRLYQYAEVGDVIVCDICPNREFGDALHLRLIRSQP